MSIPAPWRRLGDRLEAELDGVASSDAWLPFFTAAKGLLAAESLPAEERERVRCKLLPMYVGARDALMALFQGRAPLNAKQRGETLEQFLLHIIFGERIPCPPIATLFPGDPVRMSRKDRKRHFLELAEFLDSLGPRGTPGRPRGITRLDPTLAARAYQLSCDNKKYWQIAHALHLKDPRSEAARKRVSRLIDLGERLSRQKIARTSKKSGR